MCQILNVIITSCISFVLVYFYYLIRLSFSCLGHDRLRPNEMNLCSKPRLTRCTPRRNRFETVRQNIFIFLRGRSFSVFKLECAPLFYTCECLRMEKKKKIKKSEHRGFIAREELKWELSSCIGHFGLFEDSGQASCPRGTTSQVSSRLLWKFFSKLRAKLSS